MKKQKQPKHISEILQGWFRENPQLIKPPVAITKTLNTTASVGREVA